MSTHIGLGEPPRRGSEQPYSSSDITKSFEITYNDGSHERFYLSNVLKYKYITEKPINGQFYNENLQKLLEDKDFITYGLGANVIYLSLLLQQKRPIIIAERINGNGAYNLKRSIMHDEIREVSAKGLEKYFHK